ncbi:hypothetical protein I3760_01G076900 [Carya illinoinensis]|nr:hypothetical protein I3760_01G076900 [Carya illinoinensis]
MILQRDPKLLLFFFQECEQSTLDTSCLASIPFSLLANVLFFSNPTPLQAIIKMERQVSLSLQLFHFHSLVAISLCYFLFCSYENGIFFFFKCWIRILHYTIGRDSIYLLNPVLSFVKNFHQTLCVPPLYSCFYCPLLSSLANPLQSP